MLDSLKRLFADRPAAPTATAVDPIHLACAVVLMEAAMLDGAEDREETAVIERLLAARFDLSADAVARLVAEARTAAHLANEIYTYTRAIKDQYDYDDRVELIEMLWEVVYADGDMHHYESNLVRRIAGLLYVDDSDSGTARKTAMEKLGLS